LKACGIEEPCRIAAKGLRESLRERRTLQDYSRRFARKPAGEENLAGLQRKVCAKACGIEEPCRIIAGGLRESLWDRRTLQDYSRRFARKLAG